MVQVVGVLDKRLTARFFTTKGSTVLLSTLEERVQRHVLLVVQEMNDAPLGPCARVFELLAQNALLHITVNSLCVALLLNDVICLVALVFKRWQVVRRHVDIVTAVFLLLHCI